MGEIDYIDGDATEPATEGRKVIVHCCNDQGAWGSGFVVALSRKWWEPEHHYRNMGDYKLGAVAMVPVSPEMCVANLIGQHAVGRQGDVPPIRYEAVRKGFQRIIEYEAERGVVGQGAEHTSIHMPRIGCGLAGGDWALIEPLINATFIRAGMFVTVYDFPGGVPYFDSRNEATEPFVRETDEPVG